MNGSLMRLVCLRTRDIRITIEILLRDTVDDVSFCKFYDKAFDGQLLKYFQ